MLKPIAGKEKKYWARMWMDNAEQFVPLPRAYPVVIEGFEDIELCAYRAWVPSKSAGKWHVIEATSGLGVAPPARTRALAVAAAKDLLIRRGAAPVKAAARAKVEEGWLSPRYTA